MGLSQPAVKDILPLDEMMKTLTGIDITICRKGVIGRGSKLEL